MEQFLHEPSLTAFVTYLLCKYSSYYTFVGKCSHFSTHFPNCTTLCNAIPDMLNTEPWWIQASIATNLYIYFHHVVVPTPRVMSICFMSDSKELYLITQIYLTISLFQPFNPVILISLSISDQAESNRQVQTVWFHHRYKKWSRQVVHRVIGLLCVCIIRPYPPGSN